ncbi:hypothetical protein [Thiolapillus sp.]
MDAWALPAAEKTNPITARTAIRKTGLDKWLETVFIDGTHGPPVASLMSGNIAKWSIRKLLHGEQTANTCP